MSRAIFLWSISVIITLGSSGCGSKREIEYAFRNAEWLETKGHYREAIARYETLFEIAPRSEFSRIAQMRIGEIYYRRLRDYDGAKSVYGKVVNLYPDSIHARDAKRKLEEIEKNLRKRTEALNKGDSLFKQDRFREALEEYREAQSLDPGNRSIAEKAEVAQERYDEERRREASSAIEKGDMYFSQGEYENAIREYFLARELTPEDEGIWNKIDLASAKHAPLKREKSFEKAMAGAMVIDLNAPTSISSLMDKLPLVGKADSLEQTEGDSIVSDIYRTDFSIDLPDYSHYFQGYKLLWRPSGDWDMLRFLSDEYFFPFLKVPMVEFEEFEALCIGEGDTGARPRLKGVAIFRFMGRDEGGDIFAELIDARLEVPGKGRTYLLEDKWEYK